MFKELFEANINKNMVKAFSNNIARTYTVDLELYLTDKFIEIGKLIVPEHQRERGIGSAVMNDILTYADEQDLTIVTTPDSVHGGNKNRLIKFYRKFGFVMNKGKNKDFETQHLMYRLPRG